MFGGSGSNFQSSGGQRTNFGTISGGSDSRVSGGRVNSGASGGVGFNNFGSSSGSRGTFNSGASGSFGTTSGGNRGTTGSGVTNSRFAGADDLGRTGTIDNRFTGTTDNRYLGATGGGNGRFFVNDNRIFGGGSFQSDLQTSPNERRFQVSVGESNLLTPPIEGGMMNCMTENDACNTVKYE